MQELIHISQDNEKFVVSARELYSKLSEDIYHYAQWTRANITNNKFAIKDIDYQPLLKVVKIKGKGRPATNDFMLTMDFAKRISLLSKTKKGAIVRDYFLACERKAIDLSNTSIVVADKGGLLIDKLILVCSGFLDRLRQIGEPPKQALLPENVTTTITKEEQSKIDAYDLFFGVKEAISMKEFVSMVKVFRKDKPKQLVGPNLMWKYLKDIGVITKQLFPMSKYSMDFAIMEIIKNRNTENVIGVKKTLIRKSGVIKLIDRLKKDGFVFMNDNNEIQNKINF